MLNFLYLSPPPHTLHEKNVTIKVNFLMCGVYESKVQCSVVQVQYTKVSQKERMFYGECLYNNNKQYFIETVCKFWSWAYLCLFAGGRGAERRKKVCLPTVAPFLLDFAFRSWILPFLKCPPPNTPMVLVVSIIMNFETACSCVCNLTLH